MNTLAARLGHLIARSGFDFQEVDDKAGLTRGHTGQIVRGGRLDPSGSTVVALARVLGTTAEYLVTGKQPSRRSGRHVAKVTATAPSRKRGARPAGRARTSTSDRP